MKKFLTYLVFCIIFYKNAPASSYAEGEVFKLNTQIVSTLILDDYLDAVPIQSVLDYISLYAQENPSYLQNLKVLDLNDTYMSMEDLETLLNKIVPEAQNLEVINLATLTLNESTWEKYLLPRLELNTLKFLDISNTNYSNKSIQPILSLGKGMHDNNWIKLSEKLIFSSKTYYTQLKGKGKWIAQCEKDECISSSWNNAHTNFYKDFEPKIKDAKPITVPTGGITDEEDLEDVWGNTPSDTEEETL